MTAGDPRALAQRRALRLASSQFPPAAHLAYLERQPTPVGPGLGRIPVGDVVLRDVALPAERAEVIRVISETVVGHAPDPALLTGLPGTLLAVDLTWFGIERDGRLIGLHGGFFWNEACWVRAFYTFLGAPTPATQAVEDEAEAHVYAHLWGQGMREALVMIPVGTSTVSRRRAAGWADSHEAHFANNPRPFQWLRRAFRARRTVPDFPARWGPVTVREATWADLAEIRDHHLATWWDKAAQHRARVAASMATLWGMDAATPLLGTVDGTLRYGYLIRESAADSDAAVISSLHPPGVHASAASFYYAAMAWMQAADYTTYRAYLRPDCSGRNALAHDCLAQGGTLTWVPHLARVLTSYPLATLLAQPLEVYVPHWHALVAADQGDAALPPEFPAEALAWARAQREAPA